MATLLQDLKYGLRMLARNPGFTAVAVLTLALGIGANTTIFSMINGILLRPLPVDNPYQLVFFGLARPGPNNSDKRFSFPEFEEIRSQSSDLFSGVAALRFGGIEGGQASPDGLTVDGQTRPIETEFVTGNFFSMLGIQPELARFTLPSEGTVAGADPVIVLSYRYWRTRFGGDLSIIGKKAFINGHPVTVVGIAPKGFFGITPIVEIQGYMPLGMANVEDGISTGFLADPKARALVVIAREKARVHEEQAQAFLRLVGERFLKAYPRNEAEGPLRVYPLRPPGMISGPDPFGQITGLFLTLAGLGLLLACVNVANLVLVRNLVRKREMVIRAAVGAARGRLLRHLLTESLLLAVLGGCGGILVGVLASKALASIPLPTQLPLVLNFQIDWRVFAYAVVLTVLATSLVGMMPALRASRVNLQETLHTAGRGSVGDRLRMRQAFVAMQVAVSLALLIVTGLFVRSLRIAEHVDLGFVTGNVLNLSLDPNEIGYTRKDGKLFFNEVLERVRALPGVESDSLAAAVPLGDAVFGDAVNVPGYHLRAGEALPSVLYNAVSPGYFKTLGITLLRGRDLTDADDENAPRVAVVNEAMAAKFWPAQDPVGKQFAMASDSSHRIEIVGVVKNTRITDVSGPYEACFYLPLAQHYLSGATLQIRTAVAPDAIARAVVDLIRSIAPTMPVLRVETMQQAIGGMNGLYPFVLGAGLTAALGLLGLALAIVGIIGVTSYVVTQRTQEIGIRIALGARRGEVLRLVLGQGFKLTIFGVAIGILGAIGLSRLLSGLLYGVKPTDPLTFIFVSCILVAVALLASYIPARRATKVDPMVALRYE